MNDSVNKKFLKSKFGQFTTQRVKAGKNNNLRSIVNNDINTGRVFKGFYIASLTSDNTAFEFIALDMNYREGVFGSLLKRDALYCCQECFLGKTTRLLFGLFVNLMNGFSCLLTSLCNHIVNQHLPCILSLKVTDAFKALILL